MFGALIIFIPLFVVSVGVLVVLFGPLIATIATFVFLIVLIIFFVGYFAAEAFNRGSHASRARQESGIGPTQQKVIDDETYNADDLQHIIDGLNGSHGHP